MQPTISHLKSIFESKASIFRELKKYIKPVSQFVQEPAMVYQSQEDEDLILEKHVFGRDKGLLPEIEKLIELNGLILAYDFPFEAETLAGRHYAKMLELVNKEQNFLINYFKRTLEDVVNHRQFKSYWGTSFKGYQNLLNIIRLDLTYFSLLLQTLAKSAVIKIINFISLNDLSMAHSFLHEESRILSEKEAVFLKRLLESMLEGNLAEVDSLKDEGMKILERDEGVLLAKAVDKWKELLKKQEPPDAQAAQIASGLEGELDFWTPSKETPGLGISGPATKEESSQPAPVPGPAAEEMTQTIGKALEAIGEAYPEVRKLPVAKRAGKSGLRVKARARLARKLFRSKREAVAHGYRVLMESISLRKKMAQKLKDKRFGKALVLLKEEKNKLLQLSGIVAKKIAELQKQAGKMPEREFKDKEWELESTKVAVESSIFDTETVEGFILNPEESQKFIERYSKFAELDEKQPDFNASEGDVHNFFESLKSEGVYEYYINLGREFSRLYHGYLFKEFIDNKDLPKLIIKFIKELRATREYLESLLKPIEKGVSRRKFLMGFGAVGLAAAGVGGAAYYLSRQRGRVPITAKAPPAKTPEQTPKMPQRQEPKVEQQPAPQIESGNAIPENVLFIGSDMRTGREKMGERGDSLILIKTERLNKRIMVLTIPRDTYVKIPGRGMDKINHALAFGGWRLQKAAVEEFLGLEVDKVLFMDLNNLRSIFNYVKKNGNNSNIIVDTMSEAGLKTFEIGWDSLASYLTGRNYPEAAVRRAKNHAVLVSAFIRVLNRYYKDAQKKELFELKNLKGILNFMKYSDMSDVELYSLFREWSLGEYNTETYYVPGKPARINNISYWIPQKISGVSDYFNQLIRSNQARVI